jgi:hypothetical protein
MTAKCYNGPGAYANLEFDNWPWASTGDDPMWPLCPVFAMLLTDDYTPDLDNESKYDDIKASECPDGVAGYTAGGVFTLLNNTIASEYKDLDEAFEEFDDYLPPLWIVPQLVGAKAKEGDPLPPAPELAPRYCAYYIKGVFGNPLIAVQDLGVVDIVEGAQSQVMLVLADGVGVLVGGGQLAQAKRDVKKRAQKLKELLAKKVK